MKKKPKQPRVELINFLWVRIESTILNRNAVESFDPKDGALRTVSGMWYNLNTIQERRIVFGWLNPLMK